MRPLSQTKPPRGGLWRYEHPISGYKFSSHQLGAIKHSIWQHESANGYPETSDEDIENQLCKNHASSCGDNSSPRVVQRALHVSDIVRGTKVLVHFKATGSKLVSQEHANRRAEECANCKKNVDYRKPCAGLCAELVELVKSIIGEVSTPYDSQLKACGICACSNAAQVHIPANVLASGVNDRMMEEFRAMPDCWKWKEIEAVA